ncbi:LCP family protein [Streptomyces sp. NPDC001848]|uniref:LCP family protein n=1 Tax=Streptomyces sp. NPDC001848 TaxID=3364618 RepID=UPI0036765C12
MSDLRDGRTGRGSARNRTAGVPRQRTDGPTDPRPAGGRAASRTGYQSHPRRRGRPRRRDKRGLRIAGICLTVLVLVVSGGGWWLYEHLNGNIHSVALDGSGGSEKADAFGRTPINILVIGSDGRTSKADCNLGGGCSQTGVQSGNGNADVEMVVHIAADRSNATVMSIPRDTMTNIPACTDPTSKQSTAGYYGQVNSALSYGPACQVATIHQMTGIPIDHFVKLDFSGVVSMSDAVGGVSVCVSDNVYDTYSHLKLSKGTHTLKGVAALEFVRSRHGFGDGSDLGRTYAQHLFLSSMLRKFKSAGTLADPTAVYGLADAATKALTVDDGLGSISKLIGLAADVNKVPPKAITFTTMQTAPDPYNKERLVVGPGARSLFATIVNDQSLTGSGGKKSPAPSATATAQAVDPSQVAVKVENGTTVSGRASVIATALTGKGFSSGTTTANAPAPTATTTLTYGTGQKPQAQAVARALGLPSSRLKQGSVSGLTLVIGSDWPSGTDYPAGGDSSSAAPADTHAAVSHAHAQTADESKTCAQVSPYKTVQLNGINMTPAQAYAAARNQPDSDA